MDVVYRHALSAFVADVAGCWVHCRDAISADGFQELVPFKKCSL